VKTASRILGTAAFLAGYEVQDSPIYGAERRGAAIAAFTRIDAEPIQERGVVLDPDLILVSDETLLSDSTAAVLAGHEFASAVFVNSPRSGAAFGAAHDISCPVVTADLSARTAELLGRGGAFSATLGAAACALTGMMDRDVMTRAVQSELEPLHLAPDVIQKNIDAALHVFDIVPAASIHARLSTVAAPRLHPPGYWPAPEGVPTISAPGNSAQRHTGSWRVFRPVIDLHACTRCGICFALCPDSAIHLSDQAHPVIDYDNCKGCMICYHECPVRCIAERQEEPT
jgi:pyruvate ferredoxin oxidoreductase gamma subunit